MKLLISLFIAFNIAYAVSVELQFLNPYQKYALKIQSHLTNKYNIPKSLVRIKSVKSCQNKSERNVVIFCFENKKGPVLITDPKNINSLLVFGEFNDY